MSFAKACRSLSRANPDFVRLQKKHGKLSFEPKSLRTPFESLVRAISHQQLHKNAAEAILGRLMAKFAPAPFPAPQDLFDLPEDEFRLCGYSASKTKSLKDIAARTVDGTVPGPEEILLLEDEEIIERLTEIYGVGRWTVEMLLIFQLGRLDVWPVDDFGVQKGYQLFKRKRNHPPKKQLHSYGLQWQPYRTVAALYFWKEADFAKAKLKTVAEPVKKVKVRNGSSKKI